MTPNFWLCRPTKKNLQQPMTKKTFKLSEQSKSVSVSLFNGIATFVSYSTPKPFGLVNWAVEYSDCISTNVLDMTLNNLMVRFQ